MSERVILWLFRQLHWRKQARVLAAVLVELRDLEIAIGAPNDVTGVSSALAMVNVDWDGRRINDTATVPALTV